MNTTNVHKHTHTPPPPKESKLWALVVPTLLLAILGATIFFINYNRNYAEEVAAPIEQELVRAGAVKKCSSGSSGREFGGSNLEPYYSSSHLMKADLQKVAMVVKNAMQEKGYNLVHATLESRGPVTVDDAYIDKWYFDTTRKRSPFGNLKDGVITFTIKLDSTKNEHLCGGPFSEEGSIVDLRVKLPEQKWRLY